MNKIKNSKESSWELVYIDCKLPWDLSKQIWSFQPYHKTFKIIQRDIIIEGIIKICKKLLNIVSNNDGIISFEFSINGENLEEYDIYKKMRFRPSSYEFRLMNSKEREEYLQLIYNKIGVNINPIIEYLDNEIWDNDIDSQLLFLKQLRIEVLIEYECHGSFYPENEFKQPEWHNTYTCMCGNNETYQSNHNNITIFALYNNIYAREPTYCYH
jgi:hypothetical protein